MAWDRLLFGALFRHRLRRDNELVAWLRTHPEREAAEAAVALGRPLRHTHRRLLRMEVEGRVRSTWMMGEIFNHTVYRTTEEHPA